jgi:DNA-binding MarR family transcriptional regulator
MTSSKKLPLSAVVVLSQLANEGPMSPKDITETLELPPRTVSFALRWLTNRKLCRKVPNLQDMRQPLYVADRDRAADFKMDMDRTQMIALMRRMII